MVHSKNMRFVIAGFLGLLVAVAATILVLRRIDNHQRLKRLYCEAIGVPPYFHDTESSVKAVHEIGSFQGDEAENKLFVLASNNFGFNNGIPDTGIDVPIAAIQELQVRHDPRIPEFLAGLLKTQTQIDMRRAVGKALQSLPCNRICVIELLQYLEQIDKGNLNMEDTVVLPYPDSKADPKLRQFIEAENHMVRQPIVAEQNEIYGLIYKALRKQPNTTNSVLAEVYQLGSSAPTDFAIDFAVQSEDGDACAALKESAKAIGHNTEASSVETRTRLEHAIEALKCN